MPHSILALELSTPRGHIAVVQGGAVLFEKEFVSERSHNSMLYGPLGEALEAAGASLGLIVVGTGPGSYTGVRISIAAAQGVALSRSVPVIGRPSIVVLDAAERYAVIGDARRGQAYVTIIENGELMEPLSLMPTADAPGWLEANALPAFTSDTNALFAAVQTRLPCAVRLANQASTLGEEAIWTLAERGVEPFYVQEAFITKAKPKPTAG